jgi:hypothetical protein
MSHYYRSDDGKFHVKELTAEQAEELRFLKRLSGRYAAVGVLSLPLAIWQIVAHHYWAAFFIWILGNFATTLAAYFRQKAKEIGL